MIKWYIIPHSMIRRRIKSIGFLSSKHAVDGKATWEKGILPALELPSRDSVLHFCCRPHAVEIYFVKQGVSLISCGSTFQPSRSARSYESNLMFPSLIQELATFSQTHLDERSLIQLNFNFLKITRIGRT
jgi:hypothetical protein